MRRRTALAVAAALLAALGLAGCGGGDPAGPRTLAIATGNSTGVYAVLGRGLATLISQQVPGYRATTDVTGGSEDNIDRVVSGRDAAGFVSLSWASDAITGRGAYREPQPIRAVARLYLNYVQVIVRSDIRTLADLRGRAVSTGSPGSTGELAAARLLSFAKLDVDRDTRREKTSLDKSVEKMKKGQLDAIFWSGGLPTAGVVDLMRTMGPRATLLDLGGYYDAMSTAYPDVYEGAQIDPAGYGLAAPVRTLAEPNLLIVNDRMDPELAGALTGALLGNLPQLVSVHPEGRNIRRADADRTDPVPLHSGALRWFRDHPASAG
jgi:uncharacterized protein